MTDTEATYALPASVRDGLLDYLGHRPYREVAQAVALLAGLGEINDEKPAKADD